MIARRCQQGYLLISVVMALFLLASIAVLLSQESAINANTASKELEAAEADYLAQAGYHHAEWLANHNGCGADVNIVGIPLGTHQYSATVSMASSGSEPTTLSFNADRDAFIKEDTPAQNYGSIAQLNVRSENDKEQRALFRFDVSSIPAAKTVTHAVLRIFVIDPDDVGLVQLRRIAADWDENAVNWDNVAAKHAEVVAIVPVNSSAGQFVDVNITSLVQQWVSNAVPNYGFELHGTGDKSLSTYASKEYGNASQRPALVVTTTDQSAISPATIQSTGVLDNGVRRTLERTQVSVYNADAPTVYVVQPGPAGKDSFIEGETGHQGHNKGSDNKLRTDSESGKEYRTLLQFDLGNVPFGARVLSAELQLNLENSKGLAESVEIHRLLRSWSEDEVSWVSRDATNSWDNPGGDYDPATAGSLSTSATGFVTADITSVAKGWVDGTSGNFGMILLSQSAGGDNEKTFTGGDSDDAALRPKLTITYACECGMLCAAPVGAGEVLLVIGSSPTNPSTSERAIHDILESWGYSVLLIQDDDSPGNFDAAVAASDVVLVTETVSSFYVGTKLTNVAIGVVSAEQNLNDELGIATGGATPVTDAIDVIENDHFITSIFPATTLQLKSATTGLSSVSGTVSPGAQVLADVSGAGGLVTLDRGDASASGGTVAGRRVLLPIGEGDTGWKYLTNEGRLIVQRALAWAMGAGGVTDSSRIIISTESNATLGGLTFTGNDLAEYDPVSDGATLFLDGSLVGMSDLIDAVHVLENGNIVLSTTADTSFAGLSFAKEDLIEYDPVADTATMYLEAAVHFSDRENVISVHVLENGNIVLSTDSAAILGGLSFSDRDLVEYNRSTGTASIFFDGDATTLSQEIRALHILDNGNFVFAPGADTTLGGLSFGADQLAEYDPNSDTAILHFDGEALFSGTSERIWSLHIGPGTAGPAGPIAHWKLDDGTGLTAIDSEGGHDGTLENGPTWSAGQVNGGLFFDGSDDYVDLTSDAELSDIFQGGATVMAWIYPTDWGENGYGRIFDKSSSASSTGDGWVVRMNKDNGGIINFGQGFTGGRGWWKIPNSSINLDSWQHIAVAYDATDTANDPVIYLNGSPVAVTRVDSPSGSPRSDAAINLRLGNHAGGTSHTFDGTIDDARIYDRMLSDAEIAELAERPTPTTVLLATASSATIGGLTFTNKDIVQYDPTQDLAVVVLDGAAEGIPQAIDAVHVTPDGDILFSMDASATFKGTLYSREDVIRFNPATGVASMFLDGSTIMTSSGFRDIRAIHVRDDGTLLLISRYTTTIDGVTGSTDDIFEYDPGSGSASLIVEGADVGFNGQFDAVFETETGNLLTSVYGSNYVSGNHYSAGDIIELDHVNNLSSTYLDESAFNGAADIRAVQLFTGELGSAGGGGGGGGGNGSDYVEKGTLFTINSSNSWQTVDLSVPGVPPNAIVEVAMENARTNVQYEAGIRAVGTSAPTYDLHEAEGGGVDALVKHVQADANGHIQVFAENKDEVQFRLLGYWTTGTYTNLDGLFTVSSGSWRTQSLSTYGVQPGQIVEMIVQNTNGSQEYQGGVRKTGSSNEQMCDIQESEAGGKNFHSVFVEASNDASANIQAYAENTSSIEFKPAGAWDTPPGTYTEHDSSINLGSPTANNTWQTLDLAPFGVPANAVVQITLANRNTGGERLMGVRAVGSSLDRYIDLHEAESGGEELVTFHVKADASSRIEWYHSRPADSHRFHLMGWWVLN